MTIFYFTATGNCLYIAKELGGKRYSIPQLLKNNEFQFEDDVIGFVFPVYFATTPMTVRKFMEDIKIKSEYTFAVLTYGENLGDAGNWFVKFAAKHGIRIDYAKSIRMVDNYLPHFDQKVQKAKEKKIPAQLAQAKADIAARKHEIEKGNAFFSWVANLMFKGVLGISEKFSVSDACNSCGTCAKVCPNANVQVNGKPLFGHSCESCLACVNLCPTSAIKIKGETNPNERYRNDDISVKEIIDSNQI